jgi:hypothetical protein
MPYPSNAPLESPSVTSRLAAAHDALRSPRHFLPPTPTKITCLHHSLTLSLTQALLDHILLDDLEDLVLLEHLTGDVQGQVLAVDDTLL